MFRSVAQMSLLLIASVSLLACDTAPPPTKGPQQSVPTSSSAPPATAPPAGMNAAQYDQGKSVTVTFKAPDGWVSSPPTSSMRVAQYRLPRAEGDAEDAELIIFYFGQGQGGSTQANLERWMGQMKQPDGRPSGEVAKTTNTTVNGMSVTLLDLTGLYNAEMTPGGGERHNKPNARMRAAVVESPNGAYFVKLVGPLNTVNRWDESFMAFIKTFEFKS